MTDLKKIRKALGISRTEVCKATGVSYNTWKHWDDGDRRTPGYAWTLLYLHHLVKTDRVNLFPYPFNGDQSLSWQSKQSLQRIVAKADSRAD